MGMGMQSSTPRSLPRGLRQIGRPGYIYWRLLFRRLAFLFPIRCAFSSHIFFTLGDFCSLSFFRRWTTIPLLALSDHDVSDVLVSYYFYFSELGFEKKKYEPAQQNHFGVAFTVP
jgi:hypothetical protein